MRCHGCMTARAASSYDVLLSYVLSWSHCLFLQLILKSLEADLRKMMSPNTATNLRVRLPVMLCSLVLDVI